MFNHSFFFTLPVQNDLCLKFSAHVLSRKYLEYSFQGKSRTTLGNFFEYQNQSLRIHATHLTILLQNVLVLSSHFLVKDFVAFRPFLPLGKHHLALPEWFSFADANIHVVVGLNRNEL
jgi:hypothetical protein